MKERLSKLLTIKSLVTLTGVVAAEQFMTVFVTVIGFYFGTQAAKE